MPPIPGFRFALSGLRSFPRLDAQNPGSPRWQTAGQGPQTVLNWPQMNAAFPRWGAACAGLTADAHAQFGGGAHEGPDDRGQGKNLVSPRGPVRQLRHLAVRPGLVLSGG